MEKILASKFLIKHLSVGYFSVTDYTTLYFLNQTSEKHLNIVLNSAVKKDWEAIINISSCDITSEKCLWVLGVENIYGVCYLIIIKEYLEPFQELIFQLQLDKSDFDQIPFVEVEKNSSLMTGFKKSWIKFLQNIFSLFA